MHSGLIAAALVAMAGIAHTQAPERFDVALGSDSLAPTAATQVMPSLPESVSGPITGFVDVEVVVDQRGRVQIPRIRRGLGDPVDSAVLTAVRAWEFQPARSSRGTVSVLILVRFNFAAPEVTAAPSVVTAELRQLAAEPLVDPDLPIDASRDTRGIEQPQVIRSVRPAYTSDAMRARIQGFATLELVILPDGTVGAARVLKSLDDTHRLDRQALTSARYWLFTPARRNGMPIPLVVTLQLSFRIN